ncbi:MAG TPA: hypothetical protein VKV73_17360 [Chloroflexota bacterium]|nr:hypothetical protein [Chloroflexota bacterium]
MVIPNAIGLCPDIVAALKAASAELDVAPILTRLNELEDRKRCLANNWTSQKTSVPDWVLEEETALAVENSRLETQLEQARRTARLAGGLITRAPQLTADPIATVSMLGTADQGFLARALFKKIELEGTGHGNGRKVQVVAWELNRLAAESHHCGLD